MNKVLIITLPAVYRFLIYIDLIDFEAASKPFFGKSLFSVRDDPHIAQITEPGRDRMMMFQELALFPWLDVMSTKAVDEASVWAKGQPRAVAELLSRRGRYRRRHLAANH
jgi:hypothetical protein